MDITRRNFMSSCGLSAGGLFCADLEELTTIFNNYCTVKEFRDQLSSDINAYLNSYSLPRLILDQSSSATIPVQTYNYTYGLINRSIVGTRAERYEHIVFKSALYFMRQEAQYLDRTIKNSCLRGSKTCDFGFSFDYLLICVEIYSFKVSNIIMHSDRFKELRHHFTEATTKEMLCDRIFAYGKNGAKVRVSQYISPNVIYFIGPNPGSIKINISPVIHLIQQGADNMIVRMQEKMGIQIDSNQVTNLVNIL